MPRDPVFPAAISNSRFPGVPEVPGVVDTVMKRLEVSK